MRINAEKLWKEFWETTGQSYDPLSAIDLPMVSRSKYLANSETVKDLLSLKSEDRVLNIGCGVGLCEEIVAHNVERWVGLDFAWSMVKKAKIRNAGTTNAFFLQASGILLPFVGGNFNKILCHGVVLYLSREGLEQLFKEMKRVAMPGSLILICEFVDEEEALASKRNGILARLVKIARSEGWKALGKKLLSRVIHFFCWVAERSKVHWSRVTGKYIEIARPIRTSKFTRGNVLAMAIRQGMNGTIIEQGAERFRPGRFNLLMKT